MKKTFKLLLECAPGLAGLVVGIGLIVCSVQDDSTLLLAIIAASFGVAIASVGAFIVFDTLL